MEKNTFNRQIYYKSNVLLLSSLCYWGYMVGWQNLGSKINHRLHIDWRELTGENKPCKTQRILLFPEAYLRPYQTPMAETGWDCTGPLRVRGRVLYGAVCEFVFLVKFVSYDLQWWNMAQLYLSLKNLKYMQVTFSALIVFMTSAFLLKIRYFRSEGFFNSFMTKIPII